MIGLRRSTIRSPSRTSDSPSPEEGIGKSSITSTYGPPKVWGFMAFQVCREIRGNTSHTLLQAKFNAFRRNHNEGSRDFQ